MEYNHCDGTSEKQSYTVPSAIKKIIDDNGLEVLKSSKIVLAYVMDYVRGEEKNKKLLRIACNEGVLDFMLDAKKSDDELQKNICIKKAQKRLMEEAFLAEEYAWHIIEMISEGLSLELLYKPSYRSQKPRESKISKEKRRVPLLREKVESPKENRLFSEKREEYLEELVKNSAGVTDQESEDILKLGIKMLQDGKPRKGVRYIRFLSKQGMRDAHFLLGYCYEQGIGIDKDEIMAKAYYRQGIKSNSSYSQYQGIYGLKDEAFAKATEDGKKLYKKKL